MVGSVIVCTRNRLDHLRRCLAGLEDQIDVAGRAEIVVVDNGSSDGTAPFLADWAALDPVRRRLVSVPDPGLSLARNRGVAAAAGDVVVFIDDDAVAPRGWLVAHLRCYDTDPTVDAVGGPVLLAWPDGRPDWVTPRLEHWWSALDCGEFAMPFPRPHGPYGTNMSARRSAVMDVGAFPVSLGRRGQSLISGEEAALWEALWRRGGVIRYEPATLLLHAVVTERLSRRWILRRGVAQGRTNARLDALARPRSVRAVESAWRADAHWLVDGSAETIRASISGDVVSSDLLDDVARRAGHLAAIVEHARLRMLDALGFSWR